MDDHLRADGHQRRSRQPGAEARGTARAEQPDRPRLGADPVHQPRECARARRADASPQVRLPARGSREAPWLVAEVFISGLLVNSLAAGALTYLGDKLGVELYFAAIVAFGVRIFDNLAVIRRHLL